MVTLMRFQIVKYLNPKTFLHRSILYMRLVKQTEPCHITNAVYWDETPIVQFSGAYKWLPNRSSLKWKFYDVKFFGWSPPIPEGWRSSFGLSDRAELPGNQIGGPFFNFLAVDDRVAVARATGVAIWKKVEKVSTPFDEPAGY